METDVRPTPDPVSGLRSYYDRGTGLVIFGIVQIVLGVLAGFTALGALAMFLDRLASPTGGSGHTQVAAFFIYATGGLILFTLGVGSIKKKRWARDLTLVGSWYVLFKGTLITILLTAILPVAMRSQRAVQVGAKQPSLALMSVIVTFIIVSCAFFLVAIPLAFALFYGRKDVAQTCLDHDPVERWTSRTPLPVLLVSMAATYGCVYFLCIGTSTRMFPLFGLYLTGISAMLGMVAMGVLDGFLAIGLFRLKRSVWWVATTSMAIRLVSLVITLGWGNPSEAYSRLGWSNTRLQGLSTNPILRSHVTLWWGLLSMLGYFAYLLWLRRYFAAPDLAAPDVTTNHEQGLVIGGFIAQSQRDDSGYPPAQ